LSELTEPVPVEARRTDTGDVIIQTQVRRKGNTEDTKTWLLGATTVT